MDDLSRALGEVLLSDLECPVCMEYMVPPIKMCTNGHNICSRCRESVQCCPVCRAVFLETRNVALENIVRRQKYPCANKQMGCHDLLSIEHIAEHNAVCVYGKIKCPLNLYTTCSWNGTKNDLKEHTKSAHPGYFVEASTSHSSSCRGSLAIISCFGELFTSYQIKKDGRLYGAVQLIGTSSEASKYKCEFNLLAANGIEQISKTFLVRSYAEDFETIFNSGTCFYLDEKAVKYFLEGSNQKLKTTISRVGWNV